MEGFEAHAPVHCGLKNRMPEAWECYLTAAQQLMPGVHLLAAGGHMASTARVFVSGQVLECVLKSFLSKVDPQLNLKRKDIRHNLEALGKEAHARGLPTSPPWWLECLNSLHDKPYALRYWEDSQKDSRVGYHGVNLPPAQPTTDELQAVLDTVGAKVKEA